MIFLRSLVFNALFMTVTALSAMIAMALLPFHSRFIRRYIQGWAKIIIWLLRLVCGIRVEVTGLQHIAPGAAIIASKHQSAFDTFVWPALIAHPSYVLKRELLDLPFWGRAARHTGAVAVDRDGGGAALRAMVRDAKGVLEEGRPLVIFPEGTRVAPGSRPPLQSGFAGLYKLINLPVVPIAVNSGTLSPRKTGIWKSGTITYKVGEELPTGLPREEIEARVHAAINALN